MKKLFTLIAVAFVSIVAFADSYTITFNNGGSTQAVINPANDVTTYVTAASAEYISSFAKTDGTNATRVYLKSDWEGAKVGNGSAVGNLTINLSAKGTVKATSITVNGKGTVTVAGKQIACGDGAYADASADLDGSELSAITVTASAVAYIKSITVNYVAASFNKDLCHSPRYSEGKLFECLAGPDMLDETTKTKDGKVLKGIANKYQWVEYVNPTSTLDDGTAEVQTSNRWTNFDPTYEDYNYGEGANWIQVKGANGSVNSPVLSSAWGKYMVFYVKDTKKISILGAGSSSSKATDGNRMVATAKSSDGDVIEVASEAGKIYGKGTASDTLNITLDPAKSWQITVQGDPDVKKDIQLCGIQLFGTSEVAGAAVHAANPTVSYADVVLGTDMVKQIVAAADGKTYSISAQPWIVYNNASSTLAEGTEVQTSNRWTNIDPMGQTEGWIQIMTNGSALSPVVSDMTGKTMTFNVKGTSKFTVFAAGSASNKATSLDYIKVTAQPYNRNAALETTSTPGKIYGKGTASDSVSIVLDPTESYAITVTTAPKADDGKNPDIMLTGVQLWTADGEAAAATGAGTLNAAIAKAVASNASTLDLGTCTYTSANNATAYTLVGEAPVGQQALTINGNGATITTAADGQITTKNSLTIDNVVIDATASTVAPIAMAPKAEITAADTTALYTWVADSTGTYVAKYTGANQKCFEAQLLSLTNSTVKTAAPLISGNDAPWALRKLNIDNCQIEFTYNTKKDKYENICWYGGANSIQDITFTNSTFYCDSVTNNAYFLRYSNASNAQPQKVWGTEGKASWTMTSNTFVNISSNANFANNFSSKNNVTLDFQKNIYANTWRLQKIASGAVRTFTKADNAICGGVNAVDSSDKNYYATEDTKMGIYVDATGSNFVPAADSYARVMNYGDPRWLADAPVINLYDALDSLVQVSAPLLADENAEDNAAYAALFSAQVVSLKYVVGDTETVNSLSETKDLYAQYVKHADALAAFQATTTSKTSPFATGINNVAADAQSTRAYNLNGQRVNATAKGVVIMNGKKYINK